MASVPLKITRTAVILALTRNLSFGSKVHERLLMLLSSTHHRVPQDENTVIQGFLIHIQAMVEWKVDTIFHIFKCLPLLPQSKEIYLGTGRSGYLDYNNPSSPNPLKSDFSDIAVLRPEQKYLFHISPKKRWPRLEFKAHRERRDRTVNQDIKVVEFQSPYL